MYLNTEIKFLRLMLKKGCWRIIIIYASGKERSGEENERDILKIKKLCRGFWEHKKRVGDRQVGNDVCKAVVPCMNEN